MAKNLKLNIKNAQLAEALKLNLPKKTSPAKKGKEAPSQEVTETPVEKPQVEAVVTPPTPTPLPPVVAKKEEPAAPQEAPV